MIHPEDHLPDPSWDLEIRPRRGWFEFPLRELWGARELVALFVWRDFVATYKQTVLGTLWYIVQPLLTSFTYILVFRNFVGISTDGVPPFLFYLCGTVIWNYFSANLIKTSATFIGNSSLFSKVYFPRLSIPLSVVFSNLISFGIQLGIFLLFWVFFKLSGAAVKPNTTAFLLPLLLILMAALGLGFGTIISALTTRYRDLQHLVTFGTQLLLFATPVIYPVSAIPENLRWIVFLNPISSIVETFRHSLLGSGSFSPSHLLYSCVFAIVVLFCGLMLFNRAEYTVTDTI